MINNFNLMEMFGTFKNENVEMDFSIREEVEKTQYTELDYKISCEQIKAFDSAIDYLETVVDCKGRIKETADMVSLELKNYKIKPSDEGKYVHVVDIITGYKYGTFSLGNKKLCDNENIQFILFNLLQIITCPNATAGCLKFCYADKTNTKITAKGSTSRFSRVKNTALSMVSNFDEVVNEVIKYIQSTTKKTITFRWHESGDIYSKKYFEKMKNVMFANEDIKFMFYTKTVFTMDEINTLNEQHNISMRYSMDNTTSFNIVKKVYENKIANTIVIDKQDVVTAADTLSGSMICNMALTPEKREAIIQEIKTLETNRDMEHRKTYKNKIQSEINKLADSLINKNQKCHECMKCLNLKNNTIAFFAH